MNKWWIPALTALALLNGCASVERGSIPVVDSSSKVSNGERAAASRNGTYRTNTAPVQQQPQAVPQDSGVVVMVPGAVALMQDRVILRPPVRHRSVSTLRLSMPLLSIRPRSVRLPRTTVTACRPPLPRPEFRPAVAVCQRTSNLTGPYWHCSPLHSNSRPVAISTARRPVLSVRSGFAPREPQVLYRLAQVRLAQGDAAQAEQLARRGLTYANGRTSLQASLWGLIAQSREKQGDAAGAALARQKAR